MGEEWHCGLGGRARALCEQRGRRFEDDGVGTCRCGTEKGSEYGVGAMNSVAGGNMVMVTTYGLRSKDILSCLLMPPIPTIQCTLSVLSGHETNCHDMHLPVKSDMIFTTATEKMKYIGLQSILHDSKIPRKINFDIASLCGTVIFRRFRHCARIRCHESRLHPSRPKTQFSKSVP